ncbi:MAG: TrbG/VirB9 family P-type conjugative transfer protein [bacterium]
MLRFPLRAFLLAALALPPALSAAPPPGLPLFPDPFTLPDATPAEALLDPGPLPPEATDPEEPPILARPDAAVFTYGEEIPRIKCLPYRACTMLLAADETILSFAIGDSERWNIENFSGPDTPPTVVLKPSRANLLTNLVIRTDRRLYVAELLSPAPDAVDPRNPDAPYDALVTWSYPHRWAQTVAQPPTRELTPDAATPEAPPQAQASPDHLNFAYSFDRPLWPRHRLRWTPEVVYDDGERTFIRLPPQARNDLPAVVLLDPGGEPAPVEATLTGPGRAWLLVPTVAPRLRLVSRSGGTTRRLTIVRTP